MIIVSVREDEVRYLLKRDSHLPGIRYKCLGISRVKENPAAVRFYIITHRRLSQIILIDICIVIH